MTKPSGGYKELLNYGEELWEKVSEEFDEFKNKNKDFFIFSRLLHWVCTAIELYTKGILKFKDKNKEFSDHFDSDVKNYLMEVVETCGENKIEWEKVIDHLKSNVINSKYFYLPEEKIEDILTDFYYCYKLCKILRLVIYHNILINQDDKKNMNIRVSKEWGIADEKIAGFYGFPKIIYCSRIFGSGTLELEGQAIIADEVVIKVKEYKI